MNHQVGTWNNRGQLTARPKLGGYEGVDYPDPSDPAWQGTAYMEHIPSGKISALKMWRAQEYLFDPYKNWRIASKEQFDAQEAAFKEADRLAALEGRPVYFDYKLNQVMQEEQRAEYQHTIEPPLEATPVQPDITEAIREANQETNEKLDQLTAAILTLAQNLQPKPKKG